MTGRHLEEFCLKLSKLGLTHSEVGLAILWFCDNETPGESKSPGEIARIIRDTGLGAPNSTILGKAILASKKAMTNGGRLTIKPASREAVESLFRSVLVKKPKPAEQELGYLPKAVWHPSRGYIERVATQLNGCYHHGYFDAASVLIRRLIETLLIECYEHLKIEAQIKKPDGNYPMLSEIIGGAVDRGQLSLGRDTKKVLKEIKALGDRAAHNRRYNAVKADLDKIQADFRLAIDELLQLSAIK